MEVKVSVDKVSKLLVCQQIIIILLYYNRVNKACGHVYVNLVEFVLQLW